MLATHSGRGGRTPVWAVLAVVVACGSTEHQSTTASGGAGTPGGGGTSGGSQAAGECPTGTGAWKATSSDPFKVGRAQYARCLALCDAATSAGCAAHDEAACAKYCNDLQNNAINGRCTDAIEAVVTCFEGANVPCSTPQRSAAGTCETAQLGMRCCFKRFCADPVNQGTCGG